MWCGSMDLFIAASGLKNDSIYRSCLKLHLDKGERVEADNGYNGEEPLSCKTPGGFYIRSENDDAERARLRSRHETVNMRLKVLNILNNKYRHGRDDHAFVFRAVAVLVGTALQIVTPFPHFVLSHGKNLSVASIRY